MNGGGHERDGLYYYLQCDDKQFSYCGYYVKVITTLVVFRLEHASLKSISWLFHSTRSLSKLECTICQLKKIF